MDAVSDAMIEVVKTFIVALSRKFETDGYTELAYLESEEVFIEACDSNGWEFYGDGKLYTEGV